MSSTSTRQVFGHSSQAVLNPMILALTGIRFRLLLFLILILISPKADKARSLTDKVQPGPGHATGASTWGRGGWTGSVIILVNFLPEETRLV